MAPAKKATPAKETPSLADLIGNKDDGNHPETEVETPPVVDNESSVADNDKPEDAAEDKVEPNFVFDDSATVYADENENDDKGLLIDPSANPVHTWQENHEHNLAKVHPDVVKVESPHPARVATTVDDVVYADPAEIDDKGIVGPSEEDDSSDDDDNDGDEVL